MLNVTGKTPGKVCVTPFHLLYNPGYSMKEKREDRSTGIFINVDSDGGGVLGKRQKISPISF